MTARTASAGPRASAARVDFRQIVERIPAAVSVRDVDGRFLYVNGEFEAIAGLPASAIAGRLDRELFPAGADELRRNDQHVFAERQAIDVEESVDTAHGKRIYLSHKFPLQDASGRPYAICGVTTDVTERRRTEHALRAAALAVSGAEGEAVFGDLVRHLARILDVDVALIAVHTDGDRGRMRTLAAVLDGKALAPFEYDLDSSPCRHVVGRAFRFVASGVHREFPPGTLFAAKGIDSYAALPLIDAAGEPLGLVGVMDREPLHNAELAEWTLNIFAVRAAAEIERLRAVAALRDSEASYRAIFEASADPIFVHDWDSGAIVDASPKAEEVYGYAVDELRRLRVADLSSNELPYTGAEAWQWIQKAKSGVPVRVEWRARHRDGHLMWHEVRLKAATIAGRPRVLAFVRDITASRQAEDALRASEEQYRAIFNASADALVLWNSRMQRVDVNQAYERMYGYSRDEVVTGARASELPLEHVKRREDILARTLAGESCHEEIASLRKNGERFQAEVRTIGIRHRGEPHVLVMIRDVTERKRAEQAMRASEKRYRLLFEMESDAILVTDAQTLDLLDANRAAEELWGYSREELMRLKATDLSAEKEATRSALQGASGTIAVPLRWHRKKDGTLFPVEITLNRFELDGRNIVLSAIRDITERRRRDEALARSEARLRATVEAAFDCVLGMDGHGNLIEFNHAAERTFGRRRDDVLGKPLAGLLIPEDKRGGHDEGLFRFRRTGEGPYFGRRIETTALRADGSEFPVELAIGVARAGDDDLFVGYLRDIGERKEAERRRAELEAQLRQAQKMEAIGHLTGGIAHDFNNLLTSIMGYVTLAAERSADADPKLAGYLEHAGASCRRARDLIQQMLTFSRGRRGEPRPIALAPVVRESIKLLRSSLPSTVVLAADLDDDAPAALVDPVQLEQVLMNLAINARDAMGGNGDVRIAVRAASGGHRVCASCRKPVDGEFVELAVSDTGSGIPPDVQERMFEPFYTTKAVGQGSGMGLSTVHGIVHEHDGHVVVDSSPGAGAMFRVLLPALSSRSVAAGASSATGDVFPRDTLQGRVAIVDDEPSVVRFMHDLLSHWGVAAVTFADPAAALAAIRAGDALDLVITDHTMPGMTGLELARAARSVRRGLPVVLYTGYGEQITQADVERCGVAALLRKPIDASALFGVLREHLAQTPPPGDGGARQ
jgi:PAS domain S-box-containing protein